MIHTVEKNNIWARIEQTESWFTLTTKNKEKIELSEKEALMLKKHPQTEEKLVYAHTYFTTTIWLPSVWKFRQDIVRAMNQVGTSMQIDLLDDSLNKSEVIKVAEFINSTIYGTSGHKSELHDETWYELDLQTFANGGSEIVEKKAYGALGQDRYEFLLRKYNILTEDNLGSWFIKNLRDLARSPEWLMWLEEKEMLT